jgi:hypothetical protein
MSVHRPPSALAVLAAYDQLAAYGLAATPYSVMAYTDRPTTKVVPDRHRQSWRPMDGGCQNDSLRRVNSAPSTARVGPVSCNLHPFAVASRRGAGKMVGSQFAGTP